MGRILRMQSWFNIWKSVNGIHHINRLKTITRLYPLIQRATEQKFLIKTLRKPGIDGNLIDLIKCTSTKNLTSNITLNSERTDFPQDGEWASAAGERKRETECKPEGGDADRKGGMRTGKGGMRTGKGRTGDGIRATKRSPRNRRQTVLCVLEN